MAGVAATVADGRWRAPRLVATDPQQAGPRRSTGRDLDPARAHAQRGDLGHGHGAGRRARASRAARAAPPSSAAATRPPRTPGSSPSAATSPWPCWSRAGARAASVAAPIAARFFKALAAAGSRRRRRRRRPARSAAALIVALQASACACTSRGVYCITEGEEGRRRPRRGAAPTRVRRPGRTPTRQRPATSAGSVVATSNPTRVRPPSADAPGSTPGAPGDRRLPFPRRCSWTCRGRSTSRSGSRRRRQGHPTHQASRAGPAIRTSHLLGSRPRALRVGRMRVGEERTPSRVD